jgi:hypothetical protein
MVDEPRPRENVERRRFALSRRQQCRAVWVVASASTDATDCAELLAALGLNPAARYFVDVDDPLT